MQGIGQCQQAGQLQFTYPHLGYNANNSNGGYENKTSSSGVGAADGHYTIHNVGVNQQSAQSQNNFHLASSHYYPNSGQNASSLINAPPVNLNQQRMLPQRSSMSENRQLAVVNGNLVYCKSQAQLPTMLNQIPKSRMESVSAPLTNPTVSSTMAQMCYSQQSAVQTPACSQTTRQTTYAPYTSYALKPNVSFSNVPNRQDAQVYSITPVKLLSTSGVKKLLTNHNSVQNSSSVSQTNDSHIGQSEGTTHPYNRMGTNAVNNQNNLLSAIPGQTQCPSFQQTSVRSNFNIQTAPPNSNDKNNMYTSSAPLPSQTCLQNNVSAQANVKHRSAVLLQPPLQTKDHPVEQSGNSLFYDRMNDASNNSSLCAPQNKASETIRYGSFAKIDTVSSAQAKDCSLQVSPGRGMRAVAVVLPLSQENSPSKHYSASSLTSSNPSLDSRVYSSCQMDKAPVQPLDTLCLNQILQQPSGSSNISTDKENPEASSLLNQIQLSEQDATIKVSSLPLTFAQLVGRQCMKKKLKKQKSMSENKKTPEPKEGQKPNEPEKPCEEKPCKKDLSSVPTTEWTLGKLYEKIIGLEHKENETKKLDNKKHVGNSSASQIIYRFWNGDCKALLNEVKRGTLSQEMSCIRKFCAKIDIDTVVLSQSQSKDLSWYHILLHDEVYKEEKPFTSFWRNVNKLDDIDKEFGFPYFLKCGQQCSQNLETEPELKQEHKSENEANTAVPKPEELQNKEVPSETLSNQIQSVQILRNDREVTEKHNTQAHLNPDRENRSEENRCISNAQSEDSDYSFKIEVLPPEKAKMIFEKVECDSLLTDTTVSREPPPNDQDDTENQTCQVATLEKICCIEKWKEQVFGSSSGSKCQCNEQNQNEQKLGQTEDMICLPMGPIDLTEKDIISPQESENIQMADSSSTSAIILLSESEDESQVCASKTDLYNEHGQNLLLSSPKHDANTNRSIDHSNGSESGFTLSDASLEKVQDCRTVPGTGSGNPVCSQLVSGMDVMEIKKKSGENLDILLQPLKKSKLSAHLKSQTILESFSKSKNIGPVETVELALFGSKQKTCDSDSSQEGHLRSIPAHTISILKKNQEVPRRVYVKCSPIAKSDKQVIEPQGNISVKKRLHDSWRKSLPPATVILKRRNKKFSIVSTIHGTTMHQSPITHKDKKKRKSGDCEDGRAGKRKRTHSDENVTNAPKDPVVEAGPPQENVLKFNVLPSTFNFDKAPNETDSPSTSTADEETVPVPSTAEGPSPIKTKEAWCDKSTNESSPQSPAAALESTSLFQEFQKRFKMRRAPVDE